MPFLTWYAAMLFAVVPLRNILPGAPPPGAWIDVGLVLWVLVALVTAMLMAVISWWKQVDSNRIVLGRTDIRYVQVLFPNVL
jgi:hypothetical protein